MTPRATNARGGMRIVLLLAFFLASLAGGGEAVMAQLALRAKPEREVVTIGLAERGFVSGVELRGLLDERVIHLPTLAAASPEWGRLRLFLEAQLPGWRRATLEVRIDERGVLARDLLREPSGELVLPLEPAELRRSHVRIGLLLRGSLADDRCVDERAAGGFVRIAPQSGLELGLDRRRIDDVWRLWESLPQRVEIAVDPSAARAETLHTALLAGLALARSGREIRYRDLGETTPLVAAGVAGLVPVGGTTPGPLESPEERLSEPSLPQIVVGDPGVLRARLEHLAASFGWSEAEPLALPERGELGIARLGRTPILVIRPRAGPALDRLLGLGLVPLAAGGASGLALGGPSAEQPDDAVPLSSLGAELGTRWIGERGDWRFELPLLRLPPRRVPSELVLDLLVPPPTGERPIVAAVWLDEELVHAAPLPVGPGPHRLRLRLPEDRIRLAAGVRVALLRETPSEPCTTHPVGIPAQLLASSHLVLAPASAHPTSFAELAALFDAGTPILVDASLAERPAALLASLTGIGRHLLRPGAPGVLRLVEMDRPPPVEGPFLLVGGRGWRELAAPLRLDRGRVQLVGRASGPLLEVGPGSELAIAQLARLGDRPGLWLAGTGVGSLAWSGDRLDREDLALGDRHGTRLALRTTSDRVITVEYPEALSWLDRLAPWRWGLILGFWVGLTALLVAVLRRRPIDPGS